MKRVNSYLFRKHEREIIQKYNDRGFPTVSGVGSLAEKYTSGNLRKIVYSYEGKETKGATY